VRLEQDPFPLFPGERIVGRIEPLQVVEENTALRLRAKRDFKDRYAVDSRTGQLIAGGLLRRAGDEWLFKGLATYIPQAEAEIVHTVKATILKPNQALKVRAKEDCVDYEGHKRKIGEEWLVRREGAYLSDVNEVLVEVITATTLEEDTALHLRAIRNFRDAKGVDRKIGDRYMLTREDFSEYCPDVNEQITAVVRLTVLSNRQWCVILNPVGEDGVTNELGVRRFVKGPTKFFLRPGETLETHVQDVIVLSADEAILVRAREAFNDGTRVRQPGDKFFVYGPREYWPPLEGEIVRYNIKAFLAVEPLNLYLFQPQLVAMSAAAVFILFLFYMIFLRGGREAPVKPPGNDEL
jgi:major vault protein